VVVIGPFPASAEPTGTTAVIFWPLEETVVVMKAGPDAVGTLADEDFDDDIAKVTGALDFDDGFPPVAGTLTELGLEDEIAGAVDLEDRIPEAVGTPAELDLDNEVPGEAGTLDLDDGVPEAPGEAGTPVVPLDDDTPGAAGTLSKVYLGEEMAEDLGEETDATVDLEISVETLDVVGSTEAGFGVETLKRSE
jgi:hypothetical protein